MSDVEFEEQKYNQSRPGSYRSEEQSKGISGSIISSGLAKNYRQAAVIMIIIIIVLVAATILIFKHFGNSGHEVIQGPESFKTPYSA